MTNDELNRALAELIDRHCTEPWVWSDKIVPMHHDRIPLPFTTSPDAFVKLMEWFLAKYFGRYYISRLSRYHFPAESAKLPEESGLTCEITEFLSGTDRRYFNESGPILNIVVARAVYAAIKEGK